MYKNLIKYLKTHKKGALTGFVVALFAVAAMLLGRAGYLGNFGGNLTGDLSRMGIARPASNGLQSGALNRITRPVATTGKLTVNVNIPNGHYFFVRTDGGPKGPLDGSDMTGSQSFTLPFGTYNVVFNFVEGYTVTPELKSIALGATTPLATVNAVYTLNATSAPVTFTAVASNITSNSVTLLTKYLPKSGEFYNGSCAPFTGVEQSVIGISLPVTVGNLKPNTDYSCRINIFPSLTGGQTIGMSNEVKFRTLPAVKPPVAATGTLNVQISPATGSYRIESSTGAPVTSGTGPGTFKLPVGDYVIRFATLPNYIAPADQKFSITDGGIFSNSWVYVPIVASAGTLDISKASAPVSSTFVKGDKNVPALGIAMTAGALSDITLNKVTVRLYANNAPSPWANNALGNTAANTMVQNVMLYSGIDVVGGPMALTLKDYDGNGTFTPNADWYETTFSNLGLNIARGTTMVLTAKVNLLNSMNGTTYLALDMMPAVDMVAQDSAGNAVSLLGRYLNGNDSHDPLITILPSGALSISSENNPASGNLKEGSAMNLVAKYRLSALREGFNVNKLTVINDSNGGFDAAESTNAISNVYLKYTDVNGVRQTSTGALSMGAATFSGLTLYVPAGMDTYAEIYADVSSVQAYPSVIGQTFRLGIRDMGNTASTLEVVGAQSAMNINNSVAFANSASVNAFTVVGATELTVSKVSVSPALANGDQTLLSFRISASTGGSAHISKMIFDVSDYGNNPPTDLRLFRDGALVMSNPSVASFVFATDNDQFIQAGSSFNYKLVATVHNALSIGSTLTTTLNSGLMADAPVVGLPVSQTLSY